ncbi:hypothetical protein H1P_620037 [Hyella patelloides LEGE 07179]|uniref:Uncharacterized protein n=1 Tax=Hyella patelloides LEGE 07179 TaxID=945734 RepID=A0A563W1F8_9CYAN|nr:hypothetical protein H1P_620037 [Hyella patelloides LEGE 07179]
MDGAYKDARRPRHPSRSFVIRHGILEIKDKRDKRHRDKAFILITNSEYSAACNSESQGLFMERENLIVRVIN